MQIKMSNVLVAFILFASMTMLYVDIYDGFVNDYGLTPTGTKDIDGDGDEESIMQALKELQVIEGMNDIMTSLHKIAAPTSNLLDIVGGFLSAGVGVLKTSFGVVVFPVQILGVIGKFYQIPGILITMIDAIFIISLGFLIIKNMTGHEN